MTILFKNGNNRRAYVDIKYTKVLYVKHESMYKLTLNNESLEYYIHPDMIKEFNDALDVAILENKNIIAQYEFVEGDLFDFMLVTDFEIK